MDTESPGYYTKFLDDTQAKNIPSVLNNENMDGASQPSYLISLEQENGTSQIVTISEEEAKALGIVFSNDIVENSGTMAVNKNESLNPDELMEAQPIVEMVSNANKAVTHKKEIISIKNNVNNSDNLDLNLVMDNSMALLNSNCAAQTIELNEDEARALGLLNDDVGQKAIKNGSNSGIRQIVKHKRVRKRPINIKKISQEQTYHSTVLQANGSSHLNELTEATALEILSNDGAITNCNDITSVNVITQQNVGSVKIKQPIKRANKTVVHRKTKRVTSKRKNITELNNGISKLSSQEVQLLPYPSALLQTDGISRIVQLTKKEATSLGIYVGTCDNVTESNVEDKRLSNSSKSNIIKTTTPSDNSNEVTNGLAVKPLGSCENPIEIIKDGEMYHSTQNLSQDYLQEITKALKSKTVPDQDEEEAVIENVIYRVVYPEELDLNPEPTTSTKSKRGRRKKRSLSEEGLEEEEVKFLKNVRTRSGRITRPPKHIGQNFKQKKLSEVNNMETDSKTVESEPLKTNQLPSSTDGPTKLDSLENHQRKRFIAAQFRCPKCQKAYLGHNKMLKHLQKHPDHGPMPEHCKPVVNNDTWNFLIDLSNKNPSGQRGLKFCNELVSFLHNVRILAKAFFKGPTGLDKNTYYVDETLGSVLGIESGNYSLNENELHKEINVLALIKDKNNYDGNLSVENHSEDGNAKALNESFNLEEFVNKCQTDNCDLDKNINFGDGAQCEDQNKQDSNKDANSEQNGISFDTISRNSDHNNFNLSCDISSVQNLNEEICKFNEHMIHNFNGTNRNESNKTEDTTVQTVEKDTHQVATNAELSLHNELLSENSLLNSLPNLRNSVDELMLNNVDSTQVSNLLDNSTSSDEVMNVDQFVNERLKNLTESDLELPNTSLNLDLPSLDMFQFHTS